MFDFLRQLGRSGSSDQNGEDALRLELLDLNLLAVQAAAAKPLGETARTSGPIFRRLHQARVLREQARRTGDAIALRKAASAAELALAAAGQAHKPMLRAAARLEQALTSLLGAELFGGDGLVAAADAALAEAETGTGVVASAARIQRAIVCAGQALARNDAIDALARLTACDKPFADLRAMSNRDHSIVLVLAHGRMDRGAMTLTAARMLHNDRLITGVVADLDRCLETLDPAYAPLSWSRAMILRAEALTALGETNGDAGAFSLAVTALGRLFDVLLRDHSPLDWARAQYGLGRALQALGEAADMPDALEKAEAAYDRALLVLVKEPALKIRAEAVYARAMLLVRRAEIVEDFLALDEAETLFRDELTACNPRQDPVAWALAQLSLARVYRSRLTLTGQGREAVGDVVRAKAALALDTALDVFAEQGLKSLSDLANQEMKLLTALTTD